MGLLDKQHKPNKNKTLKDSFYHAYEGVNYSITKERNMHIHITMAIIVIVFGAIFRISYAEWLTCLILIALVISLELVNTAIESVVDMITTKENRAAKTAKDAAAGAVLVSSFIAALVGIIIFLPKVLEFVLGL